VTDIERNDLLTPQSGAEERQSSARSRFAFRPSSPDSRNRRPASSRFSQRPIRRPFCGAPLTRPMAEATAGSSRPLSAASIASFRKAASCTLIEEGARPFSSRRLR
jgi:hypothetical protein